MDEYNVHQFWGISPFLDLLAASNKAGQQHGGVEVSYLQVCPYDCRHTVATLCGHACSATEIATGPVLQEPTEQQQQAEQQHPCNQLHLYIYECEPGMLARHMLLLAVLFDSRLPAKDKAEVFLELHGNALLRQRTAEYLVDLSKWLEEGIAQLSLRSSPITQPQTAALAAATTSFGKTFKGSSNSNTPDSQQQQSGLGILAAFDLSMLRYQDRDAIVEAVQGYRHKGIYDMATAWDTRCRKWYGDRYDFRQNLVDWDYHMRLNPRGTPFWDPASGSIVHFYHFRHWRLTGVAYELRDCSYTTTNTSLLSTACGRTKEFKDRQLRDVGRSVSAFGYWGDILNSPYHAFGTTADDPELFKVVNKQFSHTSLDVAEHNILGFINKFQMCGAHRLGHNVITALGAAAAVPNISGSSSKEAHRASATRGPTSLENSAAEEPDQQPQQPCKQPNQQPGQQQQQQAQQSSARQQQHDSQQSVDNKWQDDHNMQQHVQQPKQQQGVENFAQLATHEARLTAAAIQHIVASTRIHLLTGDIKRSLSGKAKFAGQISGLTLGHRHVHMLAPEWGLATVLKPDGYALVETGEYLVQLNAEQVVAFEERLVELAAPAGFAKDLLTTVKYEQEQQQPAAQQVPEGRLEGHQWQLPPGHVALRYKGTA